MHIKSHSFTEVRKRVLGKANRVYSVDYLGRACKAKMNITYGFQKETVPDVEMIPEVKLCKRCRKEMSDSEADSEKSSGNCKQCLGESVFS